MLQTLQFGLFMLFEENVTEAVVVTLVKRKRYFKKIMRISTRGQNSALTLGWHRS